jgi:nucleotide-binding universal stress UspA family protein
LSLDTRLEEHPALQWAERLVEHSQARLKILDVVPDLSWHRRLAIPDDDRTQQELADHKRQKLEAIAQPLRDRGFTVTTKVLFGKTSYEIMHEVLRSNHDLVLRLTKGAHSRRAGFFGTTSMRLLRKCPCAVWLIRATAPPRFSRVLAAVDPAPHDVAQQVMSNTIMELGQSIAEYEGGQFHIVHVWELIGAGADESWFIPGKLEETLRKAKMEVDTALDEFLSPYELSHLSDRVHLLHDESGPGHAISELAKQLDIDLIVMGTIARTGIIGALMGNTAEQVLDRTECSVLTIKPNDFISPVTLPDG